MMTKNSDTTNWTMSIIVVHVTVLKLCAKIWRRNSICTHVNVVKHSDKRTSSIANNVTVCSGLDGISELTAAKLYKMEEYSTRQKKKTMRSNPDFRQKMC